MTYTHVRLFPPHAKVVEADSEYVVELDLPEFTREELNIHVDRGVVTVTAAQHERAGDGLDLVEHLEESFQLPHDVDREDLFVKFDDGRCEIHLPRHGFAVHADATPC